MIDFIPLEHLDLLSPIVQEIVVEGHDTPSWAPHLSDIAAQHLATMSDEELDLNWKLEEFFGTIAVINLPRAADRLMNMTKELNLIGVGSFEKFKAIDGRTEVPESIWMKFVRERSRGKLICHSWKDKEELLKMFYAEAGCYLSHYQLIKSVKSAFDLQLRELEKAKTTNDAESIIVAETAVRKFSRLLILEDDGGFGFVAKDKKTVIKQGVGRHLREAMQELPADWDMVYLVVNVQEPTKEVSTHIRRIKRSWCCVAYAINHTMYAPLVDHLKKVEDPSVKSMLPVDNEIGKIHENYHIYAIYPSVVYHQAGTSQISNRKNSVLWQGQPIYKKFSKRDVKD